MTVSPPPAEWENALARAQNHSVFLRQQAEYFPDMLACLRRGEVERALEAARCVGEADDLATGLRRERRAMSFLLAVADLAGAMTLEEVMGSLSALADRSIEAALAAAVAERTPEAEARGFAALALGKLGGRELNYSSDVDLILLYEPESLPRRPREHPDVAALRIAQRLVELLQARTAEGFAFRVDLRLRPSPEVTPIVLPVDAAISYYESSALPWERAAFIRARHCAGDVRLGRYFLDAVHPFVWRRSLDFGAIGEIQSISRRIRDHHDSGQVFGPGFDVKRGRGGIREVEFFVQIHQLIHGGRDPSLRAADTLGAIAGLAAADRIDAPVAFDLAAAYRALRTAEHRLQMIDDRQTHSIPRDPEALEAVAALDGARNASAWLAGLEGHTVRVARLYDGLDEGSGPRLPHGDEAVEAHLETAGFPDPASARARVQAWRSGRIRALRSPPAREAFEAMLPVLVEAFSQAADPLRAMTRFESLIERLPSGVNFFRLLEARPVLAEHLAAILSHAPALADQLGRRPELLDGLIDDSAFAPAPPVEVLIEDFQRRERDDEDYQRLLDRVRRRVNERRFALGVQLVVGHADPLDVAEGYSRVAEAAINVLAAAAVREFARSHGTVAGSELLILGLGRLGGEALTFASDLDLVYLFSGSHEAQSNGARPLRATDYFNRLAPRVSAALSVPTAAGALYDVDTRLRPNGTDGMLAVSLESFAAYQQGQAWTWEHMALLRARPVFGSDEGKAALAAVIAETLRRPRDPEKLVADAVRMRREIDVHKPARGPLDVKHARGGLIDLEFAVHVLQLRHRIGLHPRLELALADLAAAGLVGGEIDPALRLMTRLLVMLRLVSPGTDEPPPATRPILARACGFAGWDELVAALGEARQRVCELWRAATGEEEPNPC